LQGLDALGLSLASVASPAVFAEGLATTYGRSATIGLAALVLAFATLALGRRRGAAFAAVAILALIGLALAASGHASDAPPQALTRPAVFLHTAAVAFWIGALLPLASVMRQGGSAAETALARFSRAIPFALLPLIIAGGFLAVIQISEPAALWTTAYGRVLLAKLALLVLIFGLAAFNRFRLTRLALAGDGGAERRMAGAVRAEIVVALLILATVALWRFTPPPRSLLAAAAEPASAHIHTAKAMADITVAPGRAGVVTASVFLQTGDFAPLAAKEVTLEFANPAAGVEPIRAKASLAADGAWHAERLTLPVAGTWTVDVAILVSDFDLLRLDGEIAIRR
jgi:copper transport protein